MYKFIFVTTIILATACSADPAFNYEECYSGEISGEKVEEIKRWIKERGRSAEIEENMSIAYCAYVASDYPVAVRFVDYVLNENISYPLALQTKSLILYEINDIDEVINTIKLSADKKSGDVEDYLILADMLIKINRPEEAVYELDNRLSELNKLNKLNNFNMNAESRIFYDEVDIYEAK